MSSSVILTVPRLTKWRDLDEIDKTLLSELGKNARASSLQITKRLQSLGYSLTDRAVRKRLERLERRDIVVGYSAILSPRFTSEKVHRTLLLKFKHAHNQKMLERLAAFADRSRFCTYSGRIVGDMDWIGHFTFESQRQCELEINNFLFTFEELIETYRSYATHAVKCTPYSVIDVHDKKERQHAAYEVLSSLQEYDNLNERLQATVEALVKIMGAKFGRMWLLDKERKYLNLKFSAGRYRELHGTFSKIPIGACKLGEIAGTNKPLSSNDLIHDPLANFPDKISPREKVQSFAGYPLTYHYEAVGVLAIFSEKYFSPGDFELFELFSKKVSKDITNHFDAHELLVGE